MAAAAPASGAGEQPLSIVSAALDALPPNADACNFRYTAEGLSYNTPNKLPPATAASIVTKALTFTGWRAETDDKLVRVANGGSASIDVSRAPMRFVAFVVRDPKAKANTKAVAALDITVTARPFPGGGGAKCTATKRLEHAQAVSITAAAGLSIERVALKSPGALTIQTVRSAAAPPPAVPVTAGSGAAAAAPIPTVSSGSAGAAGVGHRTESASPAAAEPVVTADGTTLLSPLRVPVAVLFHAQPATEFVDKSLMRELEKWGFPLPRPNDAAKWDAFLRNPNAVVVCVCTQQLTAADSKVCGVREVSERLTSAGAATRPRVINVVPADGSIAHRLPSTPDAYFLQHTIDSQQLIGLLREIVTFRTPTAAAAGETKATPSPTPVSHALTRFAAALAAGTPNDEAKRAIRRGLPPTDPDRAADAAVAAVDVKSPPRQTVSGAPRKFGPTGPRPVVWQHLEQYMTVDLARVQQLIAQYPQRDTLIEETQHAEVHEFGYGGTAPGSLVLKIARVYPGTDREAVENTKRSRHALNVESKFYQQMRGVDEVKNNFLQYTRVVSDGTQTTVLMLEKYNGDIFQPSVRDEVVRLAGANDVAALANILLVTGQGVQRMHHRHWIHVDVKPQNILVKFADGAIQTRLCDFGLSAEGDSKSNRYPLSDIALDTYRATMDYGFSSPELALILPFEKRHQTVRELVTPKPSDIPDGTVGDASPPATTGYTLTRGTDYVSFAMSVLQVMTEQQPFKPFCDWAASALTSNEHRRAYAEHKWNECVANAARLFDEYPRFLPRPLRGPLMRLLSFRPEDRPGEDFVELLDRLKTLIPSPAPAQAPATAPSPAK